MVKKYISVFLSLALISSVTIPASAKELKPVKNVERVQTIQKLKNLSNGKLKLSEEDGQVFLSGKLSSKQIAGEKSATKFLEENKLLFGIESAASDLKALDVNKDNTGDTYVKYQQVIKGIKVNNSSIKVHFDKDGVIVSVNGKLEKNKTITTIGNKTVSEKDAVEIAKKQYTYKSLRNTPKTEKLIVKKDNKNYEVFKVNISYTEPTIANYDVFVEAHSGEIIQTENNIRFDGAATGSGTDVNGHVKNLNLYLAGTSYQMRDVTKSGVTSNINTYSLNHGTYYGYGTLVSNNTNSFTTEDHKASVSAHYNAGKVLDFYKGLFDRNSLDNNGMAVESYTHYDYYYNNAFWDGYEMVYGDGDGSTFTYLSGDLDVVGHEMTHGVISNTADLQYHNQPGALNESMADVFGVLISTYDKYNVASGQSWTFNAADWVVGDDIYTPNIQGDALRSLSNPTLYDQPDNMSDYQNYSDDYYGDWGGVHTNSGIVNKAAYLMAKSIGMEKTAKIYYGALINYMSAYTNFEDAKNCLVQSATDLYGGSSAEVTAINSVFNSVGVGQPTVEDPYEPNDTIQAAYPINLGTTYQSYISTTTDLDFYKLNVSTTGNINITLSDLPSDYDLNLYNSNGDNVAWGQNYGTASESINFNVTQTGNYYIRVNSYSGSSTTQKYSLRVLGESTVPVTGVSLDKTTANLKVGEGTTLVETVNPTDATNKSVTWVSSDALVATVDSVGNVTGVGEGTTTIAVITAEGGYTDSCYVTVTQVVDDPYEPNDTIETAYPINSGTVYQSYITAHTDVDYYKLNISSTGNTNIILSNLASDYDLLLFDSIGNLVGASVNSGTEEDIINLYGYETGNYYIKVYSFSGFSTSQKYSLKASIDGTLAVTGVSLDKTTASLKRGETTTLVATVNPTDAQNKNVTWASSDALVATVDNVGKVTAVGVGAATVTVTTEDGGYRANCSVIANNLSVAFNSQGGSAVASKVADYNSTITAPTAPIKVDYTFAGWYKETGCVNVWNFITDKVTTNTTLYAKWTINNLSVAFNSQGGSAVASKTVNYNSTVTAPTAPTKAGYTFGGWYKETGCVNVWNFATDKVTISTTLYAKWVVVVPGIPTNFKATSSSYNSINITWSRVTGANGYEVYRSTSSAGTYSLITRTTAANYNNIGLTTNSNYYYKTRSYRMVGNARVYSGYSTTISAKPVPATPTNVKSTRINSKSIKLIWNGVTGANGYEVYRATSSTGTYGFLTRPSYLSYTNVGLITGRTYYYKIRSYRTVGTTKIYSSWTTVINAKP